MRRRIVPREEHQAPYILAGQFHQPGKPLGFLAARKTPYRKKRFSGKLISCALVILPFLAITNLVILLVPVLYAIAKHTLSVSVMHIYQSNITEPQETVFPLTLVGQVKKAGVFPAHIYFREPMNVYWMTPPTENDDTREVKLVQFEWITLVLLLDTVASSKPPCSKSTIPPCLGSLPNI